MKQNPCKYFKLQIRNILFFNISITLKVVILFFNLSNTVEIETLNTRGYLLHDIKHSVIFTVQSYKEESLVLLVFGR